MTLVNIFYHTHRFLLQLYYSWYYYTCPGLSLGYLETLNTKVVFWRPSLRLRPGCLLLHQEKIYFVTWASEAEDAQDVFCQLRRQSFGQLADTDTQETREIPGRHLGDTRKTQVCARCPGYPKDMCLGLASRDTSKTSWCHFFFPDVLT